jgi:hypothetical protein
MLACIENVYLLIFLVFLADRGYSCKLAGAVHWIWHDLLLFTDKNLCQKRWGVGLSASAEIQIVGFGSNFLNQDTPFTDNTIPMVTPRS